MIKVYDYYHDDSYSYDDEYDFITDVGAEAWENGLCCDTDDFTEAYNFAVNTLGWEIKIVD